MNNNEYPSFPLPEDFMQENYYDCEMAWMWPIIYWHYILLILSNFFWYFCGVSIWHTIGISMGFHMIVYYPLWEIFPPSCLSFFLVKMKISLGHTPLIENTMDWLGLWDEIVPDGSANYRFERQAWISSNFIDQAGHLLFIWVVLMATVPIMFILRIICFRSKFAGWYASRWAWDCLIKGFIFVFQHGFCSAYWSLSNGVSNSARQGLQKHAGWISYIFLIVIIVGSLVLCVCSILFMLVKKERRRTCLCAGMFHDI